MAAFQPIARRLIYFLHQNKQNDKVQYTMQNSAGLRVRKKSCKLLNTSQLKNTTAEIKMKFIHKNKKKTKLL